MLSMIFAAMENQDDEDFMTWIFYEFNRLMFSTALKCTRDFFHCEDIVQESLLRLIKVIPILRTRERPILANYLVVVVKHTAYNFLKQEARRRGRVYSLDDESFPELESPDMSIDDILILRERWDVLVEIWPLLSEDDQIVMEGKYILMASNKNLAGCLGCKPSSVRMKLTRARRKARDLILGRIEEGAMV